MPYSNRSPFSVAAFLLFFIPAFSQNIAVVHLKKEKPLAFFQKGIKSDSILKNKSDLFYLSVPDSLKNTISILTENGRLEAVSKDTLLKFVYLKGLKYEALFQKADNKAPAEFKSLINGASELEGSKVRIQLLDKKTGRLILGNQFFYKPD